MPITSKSTARGILIPDDRFQSDTLTFTPAGQEGGIKVGQPTVVSRNGYMTLRATGNPTGSDAYAIKTISPGYPIEGDRGARHAWKLTTEADDQYRGWVGYNSVTAADVIDAGSDSELLPRAWLNALTSSVGDAHIVYVDKYAATSSNTTTTYTQRRTLSTGNWETPVAVSMPTALPSAIIEIKGGRLMLITSALSCYYSDDAGGTWASINGPTSVTEYGPGYTVIDTANTLSIVRVSAVYSNGYITALIETHHTGPIRETSHYVSSDFGATWTLIERWQSGAGATSGSGTSTSKVIDARLAVDGAGRVVCVYADQILQSTVDRKLKWARKSSPYGKIENSVNFGSAMDIDSTGTNTIGAFNICKGTSDQLHIVCSGGVDATDNRRGDMFSFSMSLEAMGTTTADENGGGQFMENGSAQYLWANDHIASSPWVAGDQVAYVSSGDITPFKEKLLLFGCAGLADDDGQGGGTNQGYGPELNIELGGYSSIDEPTRSEFTYTPLCIPEHYAAGTNWYEVSVVNTAQAITTSGASMTLTAGYYEIRPPHSGGFSAAIYSRLDALTAPGLTGNDITSAYVTIFHSGMQLRIGQGKCQLFNADTGAAIGNIATTPTGPLDYVLSWHYSGGAVGVFGAYKAPGDQIWTRLHTAFLYGSGSAPSGNAGLKTDSTPCTIAFNLSFLTIPSGGVGQSAVSGWDEADYQPDRLQGRALSLLPSWIEDHVYIHSEGSAALTGDEWSLGVANTRPAALVCEDVSQSPSVAWHSSSDGVACYFEWSPSGGVATLPGGTVYGVYIGNTNIERATWQGWNGAAWIDLASFVMDHGIGTLTVEVDGDMLKPLSTAVADSRYFEINELAGLNANLVGSTAENVKIKSNTAGWFKTTGSAIEGKACQIFLEPSTPAPAGSYVASVYDSSATAVIVSDGTVYTKYRLELPLRTTTDGDYRIGNILIGPVTVFGQDYSWGRSTEHSVVSSVSTARTGTRAVSAITPIRREVQFAWTDGVDSSNVTGSGYAGDERLVSITDASFLGEANAAVGDSSHMRRALESTRGAAGLVVYLPSVAHLGANLSRVMYGKRHSVCGRIMGPVTEQAILGDENADEVITINQIKISEEL